MFLDLKNKILSFLDSDQSSEKKIDVTLGAISFAESSFFPVPPDFFIFPLVVKKPERWFKIATLVTITSILGGAIGYFIGFHFYELVGKPLFSFYKLEEEMKVVGELFNKNAFLAIFTAAFTPIPYKVFTIAGGFFEINFLSFLVASILGRAGRFFAVSYASSIFGKKFGNAAIKYFNWITAMVAIVVIVFVLMQIF